MKNRIIQPLGGVPRTALADIAVCETPNSNGTVRKMAKIAREALDN